MRRGRLAFFLVLPVLLTACSRSAMKETTGRLQEYYRGVGACSVRAAVAADYTDRVNEYGLLYEQADHSAGVVTVLSPREIEGLRASWDGEKRTLSYEDAVLVTGEEGSLSVTPVNAIPLLLNSWADGYVTDVGIETYEDTECFVVSSDALGGDPQVKCRTWFEKGSFQPLLSEIYCNDRLFITCSFERCDFGGAGG